MKKKIGVVALAGGLVFGGAVAGASSNSFTSFLNSATDSVFAKVAGWAGYAIYENGENKKAQVESHVTGELNRAAGEVGSHFNGKVGAGHTLVNNEYTRLVQEITDSTNAEIMDVNARIDAEVDTEVTEANTNMNSAAQNTAQSLINQLNNSIPNPPAH
jgi:hypothetical protein